MSQIRELYVTSLEEFEAMPQKEGWNYEFIDGIVLMSPRPAMEHQRISGNLYFELRKHLAKRTCEPIQEVNLVLDGNSLVPDIMVVCDDKLEGKRYEKPPLIVIEIVSPSSASRDHITKRYQYAQLGIAEYWIVSPEEKCVTVFQFATAKEKMYCEGQVASFVLPDVVITLDDIFA